MTEMPITTAEEKAQRRLEVKARSILMMGIPNEHQLKFNSIKDAKKLLEAIEKRFGGNADIRKTQRNILKFQKLVSQLELLDEKLSQEDVYKPKVKGMSSSSSSTQNMAFVSSSNNNTSNTNEAVNTAYGVSIASNQVNDAYSTNIDDMEEIDLRWQMAMLTMRERRFLKNTGRKLTINGNETIGFDKSKVECYNFHKRGHFARECRAPRTRKSQEGSDQAEEGPNYALMAFSASSPESEVSNDSICSKSCLETIKLLKSQNDQLLKDLKKFELRFYVIVDNCKKGLGYENYNAVPPPYTRNFMPPTPDLSFTGLDEFVNELVVENCKATSSEEEPKVVRKYDDAPSIEEWVLDDEEENVSQPKTKKKSVRLSIVKKEFVKSKQQEKTARKTIKRAEAIQEIGTI
ncbi:putative ribonuclease H-like domain-containing protein [Tanacetum coccineum]